MKTIKTTLFYGNQVSNYGRQHNRVDYATLAKSFDAVLCNDLISKTWEIGCWEQEHGFTNSDRIEEIKEELEDLQSQLADDTSITSEVAESIQEEIDTLELELNDLEYEEFPDVYQWYIIDGNGAEILEYWTNEIVYYNEELDIYLWGVTHFGTGWSHVLTDIVIEAEEE